MPNSTAHGRQSSGALELRVLSLLLPPAPAAALLQRSGRLVSRGKRSREPVISDSQQLRQPVALGTNRRRLERSDALLLTKPRSDANKKRWRATAVQVTGAIGCDFSPARSVLECASPVALWARRGGNRETVEKVECGLRARETGHRQAPARRHHCRIREGWNTAGYGSPARAPDGTSRAQKSVPASFRSSSLIQALR